MGSSDEEQEIVSEVTDYEFICDKNELISFAMLPVVWGAEEAGCGSPWPIFISGKVDNGLRKLYKEAIAWKFDLCNKRKPEFSVLSGDGKWFKLLKPRSRFQGIIRTVQIAVYFLHFCMWNAEGSEKALWDRLDKIFSMFEESPSEDDLQSHFLLIKEAGTRDGTLAKSKVFTTFIEEKLIKRKVVDEDIRPSFIVDDGDEMEYGMKETDMNEPSGTESEENEDENQGLEDDIYDSVCAICDNGGHLLMCDGKCLRSFHPAKDDALDADCETLGFTKEEERALDTWLCKNCEYKRHQCYACGDLGSSDDSSPTGAEVFCCVNGACGFFYHPLCVAKLLHPDDDFEAKEHARKIALGEQFACPAHSCHACKELEVRKQHELQFAVCRRCPRAYHRKCLPRSIAFEKDIIEGASMVQRAWEGLIPGRILIYCLEHEIDPEISTPRNHLKFPGLRRTESKVCRDVLRERTIMSKDDARKRGLLKQADLSERSVRKRDELGPSSKLSLGSQLSTRFFGADLQERPSSRIKNVRGDHETSANVSHTGKSSDNDVALDSDAKRRLLTLMKDASCSITLDKVMKLYKAPSTHSTWPNVDSITLGKLEGVREALLAALRKLEDGGSIKDAKAICGDDIVIQVQRWREKLRVYLAPFLHGSRYTSFGRHFTKVDKLQEVVDILHWYVEEGDMVVDFCCGSNDFSCLMKSKLDSVGKKARFKNYDYVHSKNDFNFERRDWMHVRTGELPNGSQLIMGLNPPFGLHGALANKFINKALTFKPKLIILIVPRETERLDKKSFPYDLIWEDSRMFIGKSFYLPGCVDRSEKPVEDWNVNTPTLSLWSHPDFTAKHRNIAERHLHPSGTSDNNRLSGNSDMDISSLEDCHDSDACVMNLGEDMIREERRKHELKRKFESDPQSLPHAVTEKAHQFDYLDFIMDDAPGYDDAEAADVVSRYHSIWNDEGASLYYSAAGASNSSLWNEPPERRTYAMDHPTLNSYTGVRAQENVAWTSGNAHPAYPSSRYDPSYRSQHDPVHRGFDTVYSNQSPFASNLSARDRSRMIGAAASSQYTPDPLEFHYAPGESSATHISSTSRYPPAPPPGVYRPFLP